MHIAFNNDPPYTLEIAMTEEERYYLAQLLRKAKARDDSALAEWVIARDLLDALTTPPFRERRTR